MAVPAPVNLINFEQEKVICGRWVVVEKLGSGGCGSVYKVKDLSRKGYMAALKAELRSDDDHGVLKLEVSTLAKMQNCKNVIRLIDSGHRSNYNFMVMTLCGFDLMGLKRKSKEGFCENTLLRIGIHALYAIKQVHEMGFIHRDVKPGNMMNGAVGREQRMFFLIDYGMTRSFVHREGKTMSVRKPRKNILLRGTLRYCSLNVHERGEQGRVDDLWAMLYMLVELYIGLPWHRKDEKEIINLKKTTPDADTFNECPPEFVELAVYLRKLNYNDRPDYYKIYQMFMGAMKREKYSFSDKYDWEDDDKIPDITTAVEYSEREKKGKKPLDQYDAEFLLYPCAHPKHFKEQLLHI